MSRKAWCMPSLSVRTPLSMKHSGTHQLAQELKPTDLLPAWLPLACQKETLQLFEAFGCFKKFESFEKSVFSGWLEKLGRWFSLLSPPKNPWRASLRFSRISTLQGCFLLFLSHVKDHVDRCCDTVSLKAIASPQERNRAFSGNSWPWGSF